MTGGIDDLQDAFDNAPCGYVVTTPDGEIRAVNATMASWLGRRRDALIGTPFTTLLTVGGRIHYETHLAPMLLASGVLSGVTVEAAAHYYSPSAGDVGGDFYDLFPLSRERYGFFLGDVCGKGVAAATLTSLTRYTLRAAAVNDQHPVGVLQTLDSVLKQDTHAERGWFCTVLFGLITLCANGFDVEIATGGHPPPLLLQREGSARYVPTDGGQAVGLFAKPTFTSVRITLVPGDTLVAYSDGYTEARTGVGSERFDDEGELLRFATTHSPNDAHGIVAAMQALVDDLGAGVEDDAAVLALGVPRN